MSVPNYLYDALLDYCSCLQEVINELPNVDEIKESKKYKKTYNNFCDKAVSWSRNNLKKLEIKNGRRNY